MMIARLLTRILPNRKLVRNLIRRRLRPLCVPRVWICMEPQIDTIAPNVWLRTKPVFRIRVAVV